MMHSYASTEGLWCQKNIGAGDGIQDRIIVIIGLYLSNHEQEQARAGTVFPSDNRDVMMKQGGNEKGWRNSWTM